MCIIFFKLSRNLRASKSKYHLILASNRDEYFHRPSKDLGFWNEAPYVCGGRDMTLNKEGGTWLSMTKFGQIGMLTNYRSVKDFSSNQNENTDVISRGNIVSNYLIKCLNPPDYLHELINGKDVYSPFNVLLGDFDNDSGFKFFYGTNFDGEIRELDDGIHGLSNAKIDCSWTKVQLGKQIFSNIISENLGKDELAEKLFTLLENAKVNYPNHGGSDLGLPKDAVPYLSSIFVKTPPGYHYGTRTSTVILVDEERNVTFVEKTMSDPMDTADNWRTNKLEFHLESKENIREKDEIQQSL